MNTEHWNQSKQIFAAAIKLPPSERKKYLDTSCAGDAPLRELVESLLAQHDAGQEDAGVAGIIERVASDLVAKQSPAALGAQYGPWRLLSLIAHGGMGAVYLAERVGQFEQRAAIKLINPGVLSTDARERFNSERQILARLNHPNIARLIDGGTSDDGVPWLAMEYIEGARIDEYCKEKQLDLRERLLLFRKVCSAVAYAHRNLIVHRDIKPSNILVDAHGEPKLLDFGVAKLIESEQADLTVTERRALTPRYASPEQLRGLPLSTSTDIYSLAVLLYELLAGSDPYRVPNTDFAQLHHAIVEVDPQPPSSVADRTGDRTGAPIAASKLARELKGDLDNIVLMALRKESERRYASVQALSDDIDRYLDNEPVTARPGTWRYRSGKFLVRHRGSVVASASALALIVAIAGFYTIQLAAQRDRARVEAQKASEVSRFLTELFREADPNQASTKDPTARVLLERGAERAERDLKNAPRVQAALLGAIGQSYANMAEYPLALKQVEAALALERSLDDGETANVFELRLLRGQLLSDLGRYDEAAAEITAVQTYDIAQYGEQSREAALAEAKLAELAKVRGDYDTAVRRYQQSLTILRQVGPDARADLARKLRDYGGTLRDMGKLDAAGSALQESLDINLAIFGPEHPEIAFGHNSLGVLAWSQGEIGAAKTHMQQAVAIGNKLFGKDSLHVARYLANLGTFEYQNANYVEAERNYRAALVVFKRVLGEDHPQVAFLTDNVANALFGQARVEESLRIYEDSLERLRKIFGDDHVEVARSRFNAAGALIQLKRYTDARKLLELAQPPLRKQFGDNQIEVLRCSSRLAVVDSGLGHYKEAAAQVGRLIERYKEYYKNQPNSDVAESYAVLGEIQRRDGKARDAIRTLRQSLVAWQEFDQDIDNQKVYEVRAELGRALFADHQTGQAVTELSTAQDWFVGHLRKDHPLVVNTGRDLQAARRAQSGQR